MFGEKLMIYFRVNLAGLQASQMWLVIIVMLMVEIYSVI